MDKRDVREALLLLVEAAFCFEHAVDPDDPDGRAAIRKMLLAASGLRRRRHAAAQDMFVRVLHFGLTRIYQGVRDNPDGSLKDIEREITAFFASKNVAITRAQLALLAREAEEIVDARGPSDAARDALAAARLVPIRARSIHSAKSRSSELNPAAFGIGPSPIACTKYVLQILGWEPADIDHLVRLARERTLAGVRGPRVEVAPPPMEKKAKGLPPTERDGATLPSREARGAKRRARKRP